MLEICIFFEWKQFSELLHNFQTRYCPKRNSVAFFFSGPKNYTIYSHIKHNSNIHSYTYIKCNEVLFYYHHVSSIIVLILLICTCTCTRKYIIYQPIRNYFIFTARFLFLFIEWYSLKSKTWVQLYLYLHIFFIMNIKFFFKRIDDGAMMDCIFLEIALTK